MMQTCILAYEVGDSIWWHSMVYRSIGLASGATCKSFELCAFVCDGHSIVLVPAAKF